MKKPTKKRMKRTRTLTWKAKGPGKWKTDLGGDQPEVIILELSNAEFEEYFSSEEAAKKYIDSLHILKRPLINVVFADIVRSTLGKRWVAIGPHTTHSTIALICWQFP